MTAKIFSRRQGDGPPSTQFAATIVGMPGSDFPLGAAEGADVPNPDTLSPDSLVITGSGANDAVPDVVTDIGGLPSEVPDPADAPTLSHIGRYALKRQLGAGGLGAVFEAWDPLLSRAVAVKTLQLDVDHNTRLSLDGLFLNEARAAAGLNHRYIVTIHDAGLSAHGVYIAMERLYGRDLQRALADGWRPTVEQTVQLVRRITEALAYAHARGVVHCDIKPANIFLQRRDKPKVLDFGIARILHGASLPALEGAVVGSPRYRAPEQLNGTDVDARTDLFSLGAVMYELLSGRRAFEGESLAEINRAVLEQSPRPAHEVDPSIPPEISAIATRLLSRAPADRYTCASELSADLRRWLLQQQGRSTSTAGASAATAAPPRHPVAAARRGRTTGWLVAGGVLLAAAALALALREPDRPAASSLAPPDQPQAQPAAPAPLAALPVPATAAADLPPANPTAVSGDVVSAPAASVPGAGLKQDASRSTPPTSVTVPAATTMPTQRPRAAADGPRARALPAGDAAVRDGRSDDGAARPRAAAPAAVGQVLLAVSPWAEVEVNGADNGITPPVTRLNLPEGTHTITLRNADFAPYTVQVQVSADKPLTVRHRFGP